MSRDHRTRELKKWSDYTFRTEFYESTKWKRLRSTVIKLYGTICRKCGSNSTPNVDHIRPVKYFPWLRSNLDNLQILCSTCNYEKLNSVIDYRTKEDLFNLTKHLRRRKLIKKVKTDRRRSVKKASKGIVGLVKPGKKTILIKRRIQ